MKITFFDLENREIDFLKKQFKNHQLSLFKNTLTPRLIKDIKNIEILSIFIYPKIDKKVLEKLPNLKMIATRSTGYDHIDITECKRRKIIISNVPTYGENTVAEHTFGLILNLSRKIHKAYEKTIRGDFSHKDLRGFDLKGKTIGVIGTGNIGRQVIRIANGFQMKILAFDPYPDRQYAKKMNYQYTTLINLLKNSDIITLHCLYNKSTHHLINRKNIKIIKKGAVLINTARGGIIETEALIYGLKNKLLNGAGLDVLEEEKYFLQEEISILSKKFKTEELKTAFENFFLLRHEDVIITPHNAFNSTEALQRILETTVQNIKSFIKGKIINQVK